MAGWSLHGGGIGGGNYDMQMAASMDFIASAALGGRAAGMTPEMADQMKRTIASSDCNKSSGRDLMEFLDRITEDPEEDEHLGLLHDAARKDKIDTCKHLVENLGFDVDVRANDGSGKTPLACAVSCGKVIAVRYLLDKGADLNKQDVKGFAPLHYATKRGYNRIVRLLLSKGANVDVNSSEGTPLHVAAARGMTGVMQILLEHHADPDRVSPNLCTPMAEALCAVLEKVSESTCLNSMKLLVKAGADLNSTNPDTPLVIATSKGLTKCVEYLLEVGTDANIPEKHGGRTPIEIAANSGNRCLVESLFRFTSPIRTVSDWSVEGIMAHARSRYSGDKAQDSNEASNITQNLHGGSEVRKNAGASMACMEDKLGDEGRKAQLKLCGGQAVARKDYAGASKFYAEAIMLDPADATLHSNLSLCHLKIGEAKKALVDADACISLRPEWLKGYYRKGAAHMLLKEYKEARDAFMDGLKVDPSNLDMQNAFWEADEAMTRKRSSGGQRAWPFE